MNPIEQLVSNFQDLVGQVPEVIQPFIVMLAGSVPFIEGELAATLGIAGGLNPIVAAIAAAVGNFVCVLLVVLLTSRARTAVVNRSSARVTASVGSASAQASAAPKSMTEDPWGDDGWATDIEQTQPAKPQSKGRQRFGRWLIRFGVPGASILGPLAIPTQFTSAILVAGGTPRGWVLLWQAVAIIFWTTVTTVAIWAALTFVVGV
ncbi:small multidrug efflux protein [Homoserinimonas hongtaonis]|uniref:Small multidrug efflux protein n=1 Tax=Homoserinimonas hongtaonis TaxID=2079791 RepID=A0A2U1T3K5_9MICO|nr:small multidrug efflux protein [Salinibacterium hongtaonis]AWB90565.1 small multidrug efflux protein [Salinibacterium hongtaonis]PWB98343.1 small multidrug efflux protein [Salinibacterium hongtaonis]